MALIYWSTGPFESGIECILDWSFNPSGLLIIFGSLVFIFGSLGKFSAYIFNGVGVNGVINGFRALKFRQETYNGLEISFTFYFQFLIPYRFTADICIFLDSQFSNLCLCFLNLHICSKERSDPLSVSSLAFDPLVLPPCPNQPVVITRLSHIICLFLGIVPVSCK